MHEISVADLLKQFTLGELVQLSCLSGLSEQTMQALLETGAIRRLGNDEMLYAAGSICDKFYILLAGQVSQYRHYDNSPSLTNSYKQGEQFGFAGMMIGGQRAGSAVAMADSLVLEVSYEAFFQFHKNNPEEFGQLMINLSRSMGKTIRLMSQRIADLRDS